MSAVTPTILSAGKTMDLGFELLSVDITREVNRIPHAHLVLLDGNAAERQFAVSDDTFFEPGKQIEIKLRDETAADREATVFKGRVVAQRVEASQGGMLLHVGLKDEAAKLTRTRRSTLFLDKTDDKVIGELIADRGLKKGKLAPTNTQHKELVQYYCTDWDFILSRAQACGQLVAVDDGEISTAAIAPSGSATHQFEFGISELFSFEIEASADHQFAEVESVAWDIKRQQRTNASKAAPVVLDQGNLDGAKLAKSLGSDRQTLTSAVSLDPTELKAWSDGVLARSRFSMIRGRLGLPGFGEVKLLDVIELSGIGERFNGTTMVTGIRHRVGASGWQTDLQFGLSPKQFAEQRNLIDVPAAGLLPGVNGLQIGIVDRFEADPDNEFRIKVNLPGIDDTKGGVWARLATPDAGNSRGYFFRPEPGDEVIVGFFNDDPRQPVVLGAMFGSKNAPPDDVATLEEKNIHKGIVTKNGTKLLFVDDDKAQVSLETPQANKMVLDDDAEGISLSDQHGNSITLSKSGIEIKSAKDLVIDAGGNVEIKGAKIDIK